MFQTKSNVSYINISKNAENLNSNKTMNNFYSGSTFNKKSARGYSASNPLKLKSTPFSNSKQSPKISSGKIRTTLFPTQRPLFSLLDINDKKTNSRGTSMPMQFIRRTNEEIIKILNIKIKPSLPKKEGEKEQKSIAQQVQLVSNAEKSQGDKPNELINKKEIDSQGQQLLKKELPQTVVLNERKEVNSESRAEKDQIVKENPINFQNNQISTKPRTAVPIQRVAIVSIDNPQTRNDKWKPNSYTDYELLVKNPELMKKEVLLNTFARKLPNISIKEIRDKSRQSDIFFTQPKEENFYEKVQCYTDFQNSDIFLLKNDKFSQSKSGERNMILKDTRLETYTVSKKSNSEWHAKNSMPTLLNHNSADWNLTNPDIKSIGKTKAEITKECKERDEQFNPIYRQKSLCEFIDLTRNGAPNPNRSYLSCFNKTLTCFNRRSDVCSTYNDIYGSYRDLCDKPFSKPKLV